jgi:hypothetical protein
MYAVGARAQSDAFVTDVPAEATAPITTQFQPGFTQVSSRPAAAPRRTVSRAPAQTRIIREEPVVVEREVEDREERSWQKSTMIIGGAAASGAGVGGIVSGKKGALIGAAIGGGAASIYEATRRR